MDVPHWFTRLLVANGIDPDTVVEISTQITETGITAHVRIQPKTVEVDIAINRHDIDEG